MPLLAKSSMMRVFATGTLAARAETSMAGLSPPPLRAAVSSRWSSQPAQPSPNTTASRATAIEPVKDKTAPGALAERPPATALETDAPHQLGADRDSGAIQ